MIEGLPVGCLVGSLDGIRLGLSLGSEVGSLVGSASKISAFAKPRVATEVDPKGPLPV